eukprot:4982470-Pleurochrysis_carterae.AAC.1
MKAAVLTLPCKSTPRYKKHCIKKLVFVAKGLTPRTTRIATSRRCRRRRFPASTASATCPSRQRLSWLKTIFPPARLRRWPALLRRPTSTSRRWRQSPLRETTGLLARAA